MLYSILSHNRCHYPGNTIRGEKSRGGEGGKESLQREKKEKRKTGQGQMQDHRICTGELECELKEPKQEYEKYQNQATLSRPRQ